MPGQGFFIFFSKTFSPRGGNPDGVDVVHSPHTSTSRTGSLPAGLVLGWWSCMSICPGFFACLDIVTIKNNHMLGGL
jgi:hypothetical protein